MEIRCINHTNYNVEITEDEFNRALFWSKYYEIPFDLALIIVLMECTLQELDLFMGVN